MAGKEREMVFTTARRGRVRRGAIAAVLPFLRADMDGLVMHVKAHMDGWLFLFIGWVRRSRNKGTEEQKGVRRFFEIGLLGAKGLSWHSMRIKILYEGSRMRGIMDFS